jgi:hypothetical protein
VRCFFSSGRIGIDYLSIAFPWSNADWRAWQESPKPDPLEIWSILVFVFRFYDELDSGIIGLFTLRWPVIASRNGLG